LIDAWWDPQIGYGRLQELVSAASAWIETKQWLGLHQSAPRKEFIGTELVGLERIPGTLEHLRPQVLRADTVQPVVARNEIAARVTHDGHPEAGDFGQHVFTEAVASASAEPGS
jgi:hypothetical protein